MTCLCGDKRIIKGVAMENMISCNLLEIAKRMTGWFTLYRCTKCGAYWEKMYPDGEYHGGGEPILKQMTNMNYVKEKYGITQ